PLTANGKLDHRALPLPEQSISTINGEFVAPRTPIEQILAQIWAELFVLKQVGVYDNFFQLGGHSLLATQVISRINKTFQIEVALKTLFEMPTIATLAENIESLLRTSKQVQTLHIESIANRTAVPLSFSQQRLWFLEQLQPSTAAFNVPNAIRWQGYLDINSLQQALNEVVRRHEALRTVIGLIDDNPIQVIQPPTSIYLPLIDISNLDEAIRITEAQRLVTESAEYPFDLSVGPLLRFCVIKIEAEEYVLVFVIHHIISDGWSSNILTRELVTLYKAFTNGLPSPLPELTLQYADYAWWQRQWLQDVILAKHLDYWKQHLYGATVLELPTDHPRLATQSFRGAREAFQLEAELSAQLQALSRQQRATLFMILLTAWKVLLARYSGQDDIVVGSFIANRNHIETEGMIGFFVNNIALRSDLSGNPNSRELLSQIREVTLNAYLHQDIPFEMILEAVQPERDISRTQLFQVMFVLQNTPQATMKFPGVSLSAIEIRNSRANFDLTLWMQEDEEGIAGSLEFNSDLFEITTIKRMVGHLTTLLKSIVANPDERIAQLSILTESERFQLLIQWNSSDLAYLNDICVHELFEAQVRHQPDAVAVVFEETRLTYRTLNARANQLAHYLRSIGIKPETRIAICLERSVDMIVSVLAVLKAGAAYVPLDPAYPRERLMLMLEDAQAALLITQQSVIKTLPMAVASIFTMPIFSIDADYQLLTDKSEENLVTNITQQNLAYVIYTSGSTGKPRGVMICHGSLISAFLAWKQAYLLGSQISCSLQTARFAFDVFTGDLVRMLCSGGKLVLCPEETLLSGEQTYDLICLEGVDFVEFVPALLRILTQYLIETGQSLDFMRLIAAGADVVYVKELEQMKNLSGPHTRVINSYGLTEATIDSTYFEKTEINLLPGKPAPIGRPLANTKVYILDRNLQPVPIGVAGELYIGGLSLARGYLNHPELTATKFIPNPFSDEPGTRLYRTGDLARYLPDGNIEFLGRGDYQVKIRGFRIELEEIEAVLSLHREVREAIVIVREEKPGDKRLLAYLIVHQGMSPRIEDLQQLVKSHLPAYMLPSAFIILDALPLTPNGKVDRTALP
ncbi:MAG: amino acid adenylation domain-containing protein, partial [Acidobacteriota bacterium]